MRAPLSDTRVEEAFDRAWSRSRFSVRTRIERLRSKSFHIGQCAIAAGVAWFIATTLFHHPAPVFAPIVAVIGLGTTYGQRLRRVAEITVGVSVGLLVADLFLRIFGSGPWQVSLIVLVAMSAAVFLDTGGLVVNQAAVQSIFVVALVATPHDSLNRWLDALVGGAVALVAAAAVPRAPLRRPRRQAGKVVTVIADLLRDAAQCLRDGDIDRAAEVLASARQTDSLLRELQAAAAEGLSVIASSPFRRSHAENVRSIADLVTPLDRAMRSTRVVVRRVAVLVDHKVAVPPSYARALDRLADATDVVARALLENASPEIGRAGLLEVGRSTGDLERGQLYVDVLLVQVRAVIVDLLQVTAMDYDDITAALPPLPERVDGGGPAAT